MKRLLILALMLIPLVASAIEVTMYQNCYYLDVTTMYWKADTLNSNDTLAVSSAKYTIPEQINGGNASISGKAIFTAGTDSMKCVAYGCDYPNGREIARDTMRLFPLDSMKLLASGSASTGVIMRGANFSWKPNFQGKFSIWVTYKWIPLNGTTGKITQQTMGKQ